MSHAERRARLEWNGPMSIARQCRLLGISRRSAYAPPKRMPERDLALMRRMDELHLARPMCGARQMVFALRREGVRAGRSRVRRLMRLMGLSAVAPKPAASVKSPSHKVFPYLLRGLRIDRADQVWRSDITYVPVRGGFPHLAAVMDWTTRHVLSWRLSGGMGTEFCVAALHDALRAAGRGPEIFNTDQGVQFTGADFVRAVQSCGAQVPMDGKGRWMDNRFIERLWRSLKQESVYLRELSGGLDAHRVIAAWFEFHNHERPHAALCGDSPARVHERLRNGQACSGLDLAA